MVQIKNLNKSFWAKNIFNWAALNLWSKETAWLVGINGSGKTTLFKILSWEDLEFEWAVFHDTKTPLIWYMKQQMSIEHVDISILSFLKKYTDIDKIEQEMNDLMNHLDNQENLEKYWEVYEMFEKVWGYDFEYRAEKLLNQIGLWKYTLESNIDTLSWWEKRKLLLCGTLIKWGDLLLLDEPTNDLDSSSIEGLVSFLKESLASCLIVSHDKDFLNNVTKKIFEISDNKIIQYSGNYDFYEQQKTLAYQQGLEAYMRQEEEALRIKKTTQELKQKASNIWSKWNLRDNDKWDWASKVEKKLAQSAKNMQNRIERMEKVDKPKIKKPIQMLFAPSEESVWWIHLDNLVFTYEGNNKFELRVKSLTVWNNEKLLIHWGNGDGKSTLLKLLIWELEPHAWSIKKNPSLKIGYFAQEEENLPHNISPIDFLHGELWYGLTDVHSVLWAIWLDDTDKRKNIDLLSPGMRLRLTFALIVLKKDNCLVLDEPTNHVDIEIKEALKKAINDFKWIVIVVSHDDSFINQINFTKRMYFKNWIGTEE